MSNRSRVESVTVAHLLLGAHGFGEGDPEPLDALGGQGPHRALGAPHGRRRLGHRELPVVAQHDGGPLSGGNDRSARRTAILSDGLSSSGARPTARCRARRSAWRRRTPDTARLNATR